MSLVKLMTTRRTKLWSVKTMLRSLSMILQTVLCPRVAKPLAKVAVAMLQSSSQARVLEEGKVSRLLELVVAVVSKSARQSEKTSLKMTKVILMKVVRLTRDYLCEKKRKRAKINKNAEATKLLKKESQKLFDERNLPILIIIINHLL